MIVHGDFQITVNLPVIHGQPLSEFNAEGVAHYANEVLKRAANIDHWVFFDDPKPEAALTLEGVSVALRAYAALQAAGCIAIALYTPNGVVKYLGKKVKDELNIPICVSADRAEIKSFLEQQTESLTAT